MEGWSRRQTKPTLPPPSTPPWPEGKGHTVLPFRFPLFFFSLTLFRSHLLHCSRRWWRGMEDLFYALSLPLGAMEGVRPRWEGGGWEEVGGG